MVCCWYQSRQLDQQNRIDHPEIDPHIYGQLIFDEIAREIQWRKDFFLTNSDGTIGYTYAKKPFDPYVIR